MRTRVKTLGLIGLTLAMSAMAWGQTRLPENLFGGQAKPTIEERLIRVEEGIKNLDKRIDGLETSLNKRIDDTNKRIDDTNKRIDDLRADIGEMRTMMLTGFGVLLSGMFALIGFVIWDRRTAIAPVARTTKELEEREEKIVAVLREYARGNKQLLEIMKRIGIL